jgi:hypothetical protein
MRANELKHEKLIAEKGINIKDLPKEIIGVISTVRTTILFKTEKTKDEEKRKAIEQEYIKISETLYDFLIIWLENPEMKDMDLSEIFADEEIEVEVKQEVKEQVQEIKEQVEESTKIINKSSEEVKVETPKAEVKTDAPKAPLNKRDILHQLYTAGKKSVTGAELRGMGYPMGFFDNINSGNGEYNLRKVLARDVYEISLK